MTKMSKIVIAGCGTDVGKTLVSAIFVAALQAAYWKPIQCGEGSNCDTATLKALLPELADQIHPPTYHLKALRSPHHAARLENREIDTRTIFPPATRRPLVIESVGGLLVPLNEREISIDLFASWDAIWIVVSRHYLGSINHTLLTLEVLKQRRIPVHGLIFNGEPNSDTERAILHFSGIPCIGRVLPEKQISPDTIQRYAKQWKTRLHSLL